MVVEWMFFDIGSTLIDETIAYKRRVKDTVKNTQVSEEQFMNKRVSFAQNNIFGDIETLQYFGLNKAPWHFEDERLYNDAFSTIKMLYEKGYKLGIIANQSYGTEERLKKWGIFNFFSVVSASAEVGIEKPDIAIFKRTLELAGCCSENTVMIGDRLDNDIFPAKSLGMKTVWIRQGFSALFDTSKIVVQPDYIIQSLSELLQLF